MWVSEVELNPIHILICDNHILFSKKIKTILRTETTLKIVNEVRNGRQTVEKVKELRPDVVLINITMPNLNNFEATRRIHKADPAVKVLMLTIHDEEKLVAR